METTTRGDTSADAAALFAMHADHLVDTAERACLRMLPWAPQEHDAIIQDALERVLHKLRAEVVEVAEADLAGYVYGVTRHCVQEARRRLWRDEARACRLPDDETLAALVGADDESDRLLAGLSGDEMRRRLLEGLRFYVVHAHAHDSEKRRRRALRDAFIVARHHLRGAPLVDIAAELGLTRRAVQYALDRTIAELGRLFDPDTGELRSFVHNSRHFADFTELSEFLRRPVASS